MTEGDTCLPLVTPLRAVLIAMLAWALLPSNPYGYYIFLRWFSCGVFVYLAIAAQKTQQPGWLLLFVINAGIYNPVILAHLGRPTWSVVNMMSIILIAVSLRRKIYQKENTMYNINQFNEQIYCPHCSAKINLNDEIDGEIECSSCGGHIRFVDDSEDTVFLPEVVPYVPRKKWRRGWKNFFAIIIGMLGGWLVHIVLGIPLALLFSTNEGLPQDITLILKLFTAFIAGALAATLVPRLGWLFGMLTQALELALTIFVIGVWAYVATTEPEVDFNLLGPLRVPLIRMMLFSIACATLAGAIAENYRENIMSFLASTFGWIFGSFGCLLQASFGLVELYFLYLGGKAIFADGEIFKGLAIVLFVGPIAGTAIGGILMGILMGVSWVFSKIYNSYAEDLDLDPI